VQWYLDRGNGTGSRRVDGNQEKQGVDEVMEDERNGKEMGVDMGSLREWGMRGIEKRRG
jgi:hypothetical protein